MVPDTPPHWDPLMDPDPLLLLSPSGQEGREQDAVPPVQVTPLGGSMCLYQILGDPPSGPHPPRPRLLLVLLPWLGAQPGHLWPYLRWYLGHGLDVLVVPTKAWHFLRPQRGQRLARSLLRALEDGEGETGGTGGGDGGTRGGGGIGHAAGSSGDGGTGLAGGHSDDSEGGTRGDGGCGIGHAGDGDGGTGLAGGQCGDSEGGTRGGDAGRGGNGPAGGRNGDGGTGGTDHTDGGTHGVGNDCGGGTGLAGTSGGGGGDTGLSGASSGAAGGTGINTVCLGTGASGASPGAAGASALAGRPLLVHAISAGAYTFAQLLLLLRQHPGQCQRLAPRFRGIVYDSLVTGDFGDMARGLANAVPSSTLRPLVRASAHFYLWALGCCVGRELALARAAFANTPLRCPLLLFYSLDDELSQAPTLRALLAGWRALGICAHAVGWQHSRHAAHLRWHPQEYRRALLAFLKLTEGAPRARL